MARPRQAILSKRLIFSSALELIDKTGRFTVPELAQRLGVSVSSLYHHVAGRAAVVEGIRGLLAEQIDGADAARPWPERVRRWAESYRAAFAGHPAAIPLLVGQTITDSTTLAAYDTIAEVLTGAGLTGEQVVTAVIMLDTLCLGAALDTAAPTTVWSADGRDSALGRALAAVPVGAEPSRTAFERQLTLIIDSLAEQTAVRSG